MDAVLLEACKTLAVEVGVVLVPLLVEVPVVVAVAEGVVDNVVVDGVVVVIDGVVVVVDGVVVVVGVVVDEAVVFAAAAVAVVASGVAVTVLDVVVVPATGTELVVAAAVCFVVEDGTVLVTEPVVDATPALDVVVPGVVVAKEVSPDAPAAAVVPTLELCWVVVAMPTDGLFDFSMSCLSAA